MQLRFAMMFSVTSLAGAFSGLLAFGIRNLNGKDGISGWRWIFILVRHSLLLPSGHVTVTTGGSFLGGLWTWNFFLGPFLAENHQVSYKQGAPDILP